jgi:RHS repeat-associated protein
MRQTSEAQSLGSVDNDASTLTSVRLGALSIPTGTRGTLHYDDFDSRRFSQIGLLPDPGLLFPAPEGGRLYSYDDPEHVHAVTGLSNGDAFTYDANGNMTCRVEDEQTFIQSYNDENRISQVELVTGSCNTPGDTTSIWNFTYDGDGVKVMQVYTSGEIALTTRYYMGGAYEVTSTEGQPDAIKKYYSLSGMTVAMNDGTNLYYFLTDHLGSVVAITDNSGTLQGEQRYMPFGQVRTDVGTINQTDFGYTFQRNLPAMGLMDYKARFYDANIGRFVQPDSILPGENNPGAWNRFSYSNNNPIYYTDPSGHVTIPDHEPLIDNEGSPGYFKNQKKKNSYDGNAAAKWIRDNLSSTSDDLGCLPGTRCTCFINSGIKAGLANSPLYAPNNISATYYYQTGPFVAEAIKIWHHSNPFEKDYVGVDPVTKYPIYGKLSEDPKFIKYVQNVMPNLQVGDVVAFQQPNTNNDWNHVAMIIDFQPDPKHDNQIWPVIADMDARNDVSQIRFIDDSPSEDIGKVIFIFVGR